MSNPSVSIVIPTKNRPRDLLDTVRTILTQISLPQEIVIIDQSSTDESHKLLLSLYADADEAVRRRTKLVYITDTTLPGLTAARNRGMAAANGDIILFLDDDVFLEPAFLRELLKVYDIHKEAVGVSGVITNYTPPAPAYRLWNAFFMRGPLFDDRQPVYWSACVKESRKPVRVTRLGGGLMSFRVEAIKGVLFDENLRGVADGEDVDFCVRLGKNAPLFIAPAARLVHNQSPQGREQGHWLRRHARGTIYLYRKNWSRTFRNRACMAWLNVGYVLVALIAVCHRWSTLPWRAFLDGRREGLSAAGVG